jgi:hypothetical protein
LDSTYAPNKRLVKVPFSDLAIKLLQFASIATVNVASELISIRITHGAEMSRNLRASKASKQAGVIVIFWGKKFRTKSVNGALRSLKW